MRTIFLTLLIASGLAPLAAFAEKADREKEVNVSADVLNADDKNRTSAFEGSVIVTQGTMRITAAKVTVKEDPERNKFYVAVGSPVTFRQKRDKVEDYIEGYAERAEFDDKSDMLKLFNRARLKSAQGEITGDLITYDKTRELFQVSGREGTQTVPASRVKATLMPTKKKDDKAAPVAPNPPVTLKPDAGPGTSN
jgi:lipopolysaccharide export system protein LptA